jgi:hypothetical protein
MRDVAHQAAGAHLLGLARHTKNMLLRFAQNISASRDWCTFWEIDQFGRPCPVDYRDDGDFWFCLPAPFDVLDCCWRQFAWTGDQDYLEQPAFRFFYAKSVDEFVRRWDTDGDGIADHNPACGYRGIATYNEAVWHPLAGGDQLAAQFAGFRAYAEMMDLEGRGARAEEFRSRAAALASLYNGAWWDAPARRYHSYLFQDRTFCPDFHGITHIFPLYMGLVHQPERVSASLDELEQRFAACGLEDQSYLPEILFRYGRPQAARRLLQALFDPGLARREYPELSYALIGALGTGMLGVQPDARERLVTTLPQLPPETEWAEMGAIPVFEAQLTVRHTRRGGGLTSQLIHHSGRPLYWRAAFSGAYPYLRVDGQDYPTRTMTGLDGTPLTSVLLRVCAGETHVVETR